MLQLSVNDLLNKVSGYLPDADLPRLEAAYRFAQDAHKGQTRRSGEPYLVHPLGVASIIADLRLDEPSVCAGLLHDTIEDTKVTLGDIEARFGKDIAELVDGVTKIGKISWTTREDRQAENFRKMLIAMARDLRVILVKLADRTDNMRTLQHMPSRKQERIARETMDIYAPLAHRLGVQWIKTELEDLSFRYLHPEDFQRIADQLARQDGDRRTYIDQTSCLLREVLEEDGVRAVVNGRLKHYWSIHHKMQRAGHELEQIYDVVGFRVITEMVQDCWNSLGIIHAKWTPVPGRFKDFINLPKPNMYQSLHTTVIGPRGEKMEVQIRTHDMHRTAEQGVAAHWRYKEGKPLRAADEKKFKWLRQLVDWQKELRDPNEFMASVKGDLFSDEVYVFTPKGDVKAFPQGATPVDFAYAVHSEVGNRCSGSRINGQMVPLRYQLRNGDTVEIMTNPHQKPNKDWLRFVVTSRATTQIRRFIRDSLRERAADLGKELLERELRKHGVSLVRADRSGWLEAGADRLSFKSVDTLIASVGYGKTTPKAAAMAVVPEAERKAATGPTAALSKIIRKVTGRAPSGIKVQGMDDILIRYARCCNAVPGDSILGFISHGRGVVVHRRDCSKSLDMDPARRVDVEWDEKKTTPRPVTVQVRSVDKPGLLANISKALGELGVNINGANCKTTEEGTAVNTFEFTVSDVDQLRNIMRKLQRVGGVHAVKRL